jgi:hypothetical protein
VCSFCCMSCEPLFGINNMLAHSSKKETLGFNVQLRSNSRVYYVINLIFIIVFFG